ncbi:MAG: hypothetical protein CVU44_08035 [Chloroflexi bacterium HGW-Chloroflexi-6]|nr:MAG: hypothetical protein CVU44_08035 [Chloroflexi bacterium HGW-Chloroflexi-6]
MSQKTVISIVAITVVICLIIVLIILIPFAVRLNTFGSAEGKIVYNKQLSGVYSRIYITNALGNPITQLSANDDWDVEPVLSPDGTKIAFECHRPNFGLCVMNSDGTNRIRIPETGGRPMFPNWSPNSQKVVFEDNGIYAVNSDGLGLERLTDSNAHDYWEPVWSPDGSKIAYVVIDGDNWEIYTMNSNGTEKVNLTNHPGSDSSARWSKDSAYIFFDSDRSGDDEIYRMNVDGTNVVNLTNSPETDEYLGEISPDGQKIVFSVHPRDLAPQEIDVYTMNGDGTGRTRLTKTSDYDSDPIWSPDGKFIAFVSGRSGEWLVYMMTSEGKSQTKLSYGLSVSGVSWQP